MDLIRNMTGTSLITPGANLSGRDRVAFDNFKSVVDRCTHDMLIRPDWVANMECVDLANAEKSRQVMAEVVFLLKKKLTNKDPRIVLMTLHLVEAMVKNGTSLVHASIGNDFFMKEMANVARVYNKKLGQDNRDVVDQSLDMIQAWGEGFESRQQQYPAFYKYYQELRREGAPFNQEFDRSKAGDFAPPADGGNPNAAQEMEDEILAAALAASLASEDYNEEGDRGDGDERRGSGSGRRRGRESNQQQPQQQTDIELTHYPGERSVFTAATSSAASPGRNNNTNNDNDNHRRRSHKGSKYVELINSTTESVALLNEVIDNSTSPQELRDNEIAEEVAQQLRGYQSKIVSAIDVALTSHPEHVEALFKSAEDCVTVLTLYDDMRRNGAKSPQAKQGTVINNAVNAARAAAATSSCSSSSSSSSSFAQQKATAAPVAAATVAPLLDFSDADDMCNPMLRMTQQNQQQSTFKQPLSAPPAVPVTQAAPAAMYSQPPVAPQLQPSSHLYTTPPQPQPSSTYQQQPQSYPQPSAAMTTSSTVMDDPFGNTSSIDALLIPASGGSSGGQYPQQSNSNNNNNDLLDLFK